MPFSFPANPTAGQQSVQNGRTFSWSGYAWELVAPSGEDALLRSLFAPPTPTGLTATAGNAQATLSWTAPTGVIAQAPITDYREQFSSDNGTTWTTWTAAASTATSATVTGLTTGTAYVFRVAAVNAVGVGAYTAASSAATPSLPSDDFFANVSLLLHMDGTGSNFVDSSPTTKTITASGATQSDTQSKWGGKAASFGGTGSLSAGGSPGAFGTGDFVVEAWVYLTASAEQFLADTRTGVSASGVGFRIFSDNKLYFSGDANNALTTTTVPLNQWAHVAWVRTSGNIYGYINGVLGGSASFTNNLTHTNFFVSRVGFVDAGSINGFIDDFRVTVGSNRGYAGNTITVPTAAFPDSGPISAPTALTATLGNAQVSLTWTAPPYNGGSAITDYSVQFSSNSGSTWTTFSRTASTTASQVVTGLTNDTAYVFRVAGINSNGTGTYTAASSSVTPSAASVPGAPTLVRNGRGYWSCDNGGNAVMWNAPSSNGGSAITGYVWRIGSGSLTSASPSTGTSDAFSNPNWTGGRVEGLPTGGSFQVAAVNAIGTGAFASVTLQQDCN